MAPVKYMRRNVASLAPGALRNALSVASSPVPAETASARSFIASDSSRSSASFAGFSRRPVSISGRAK